jgi:hypothetical protein
MYKIQVLTKQRYQNADTRRAVDRMTRFSEHLTRSPLQAQEILPQTHTPVPFETTLPSRSIMYTNSHDHTPLPTPASTPTCLPSFKYMAQAAAGEFVPNLPATYDYMSAPFVKVESAYSSPPESVASLSPSPAWSSAVLPSSSRTARRRSSPLSNHAVSSSRVEKKTKGTKRKDMSMSAEALDNEINARIDEIQRPYRGGNQTMKPVAPPQSYGFPRFGYIQQPYESKRARTASGSCDANQRHNDAQTHLRSEKGSNKMTLQRLLVSGFKWIGDKLQTKVNARSSGMLYEEKELLQANSQVISLCTIIMQELFTPEGMHELGGKLHLFEPEEVRPQVPIREPQDDDKTYEFKCQMAKIEVIAEATQPLRLKSVQSERDLANVFMEHLMPLANPVGQMVFQKMCHRLQSPQAKF